MIEVYCLQGSAEWEQCRLGVPTASAFSRIVTPTGKLSDRRDAYIAELLAEWALGRPVTAFAGTAATERGHEVEPEALNYFCLLRDTEVRKVGFVYRDEGRMVGASPDFMLPGDIPGELKCPMDPGVHLLRLIRGCLPKEYAPQVQGQMWVCGSDRAEFLCYYPALPPLVVTVEADAHYQAALDKHIPAFIAELLDGREKLRAMGIEPATMREVA